MRRGATALLAALTLAVSLPAASAADDVGLAERAALTGDWGRARGWLEERGIEPFATYVTGVWANVSGGFEKGARYEGLAQWGIGVDLERIAGWTGASFHVDANWYHGGQPSTDLVGPFANDAVSKYEGEDAIRLYHLYVEQLLFDERLRIKVGQIGTDDDFPDSRNLNAFANAGFAAFAVGRDLVLAPFYPLTAPGAVVEVEPTKRWAFTLGAYVADTGEDVSSNHGFDWSFDDGVTFAGRIATRREPFGLPGRYTLGGIATTAKIPTPDGERRGAYRAFARVDQALVVDSQGEVVLGATLRGGLSPREKRAVVSWYAGAALVWYQPIPGRKADHVALGAQYTEFSDPFLKSQRPTNLANQETFLEFSYEAAVTGWLTVQPVFQYYWTPLNSRRDAVVLGLQAVITL